MKAFRHKTHTAYEIRNWSANKKGLVIIKKTGDKLNLKSLLHFWKFYIRIYKNNWFLILRTPILKLEKFNGSLEIGHPNCYLWVIW